MISKLRFIGISIFILFAIVTLIGLTFPSSVIVSRAVNIPSNKNVITPFTHNLNNWSKWIKGANTLHINSLFTAQLNNTSILITNKTDSNIISVWKDSKGKTQTSTINLYQQNDITIVQWQFEEKFKWYPWQRLSSMFNEKMLGPVMEESLDSLKAKVIRFEL
ncbi:MAG: hypothetical protein ACOVMM_06660 [Chitinophagaceae bacterium]